MIRLQELFVQEYILEMHSIFLRLKNTIFGKWAPKSDQICDIKRLHNNIKKCPLRPNLVPPHSLQKKKHLILALRPWSFHFFYSYR